MNDRLPAVPDRPVSERAYWAKRIRQWLLRQSESTRANYGADLLDFSRWAGAPSVDAAFSLLFMGDPETVVMRVQAAALDYVEDLQTRPVEARGSLPARTGLATATIQRRIIALRAIVNLAVEARFCPRDITLPKPPKVRTLRDTSGIPRSDYLQILDTFEHAIDNSSPKKQQYKLAVRDRAILRLLHDVGLRRVEVFRMQLDGIVSKNGKMSIWIQRKGDKSNELQLWPIAALPAREIQAWLEIRGRKPGAIFTTTTGRDLSIRSFNAIVAKWGDRAEIGHVRPHQLRHTAVDTLGRKTDGNIVGMQGFAGHADPKMTARYIHNEDDEIRALQELLGGEGE